MTSLRWRPRLEQFAADTRFAFRAFGQRPGFTLTAVLTIGLGMGVNTALFSVMHAGLFRPLPVGPGVRPVSLDDVDKLMTERTADELTALDEPLERLLAVNPRAAQIVERRFFATLSAEETAAEGHRC